MQRMQPRQLRRPPFLLRVRIVPEGLWRKGEGAREVAVSALRLQEFAGSRVVRPVRGSQAQQRDRTTGPGWTIRECTAGGGFAICGGCLGCANSRECTAGSGWRLECAPRGRQLDSGMGVWGLERGAGGSLLDGRWRLGCTAGQWRLECTAGQWRLECTPGARRLAGVARALGF